MPFGHSLARGWMRWSSAALLWRSDDRRRPHGATLLAVRDTVCRRAALACNWPDDQLAERAAGAARCASLGASGERTRGGTLAAPESKDRPSDARRWRRTRG